MEDELKTNARNLTQATQYEIRKSIIRLSQQGKNTHEIAEILNVSERHVQNTKLNYVSVIISCMAAVQEYMFQTNNT